MKQARIKPKSKINLYIRQLFFKILARLWMFCLPPSYKHILHTRWECCVKPVSIQRLNPQSPCSACGLNSQTAICPRERLGVEMQICKQLSSFPKVASKTVNPTVIFLKKEGGKSQLSM